MKEKIQKARKAAEVCSFLLGTIAVDLSESTMYCDHTIIQCVKTGFMTLMYARADLEAGTVQKEEAVAQGPAAVYH